MDVKCMLCDREETLDDNSILAKRLRNRPIYTYLCKRCNDRITKNTKARIATGNFKLYRPPESEDKF